MEDEIIEKMESIIGPDWVLKDKDQMRDYLEDETPDPVRPASVNDVIVVKPEDESEISDVLKFANEENISVLPRGGGTGLCGAAVPTESSIILSMERLNKILELDEDNFTVTCEAGLPLEKLFERLDKSDTLFFPPHPGDEGAHVGGLIAENAGGARAVKYGVLRNYVEMLEVVLPSGEIVELGRKVIKNNTGLDLLHLMIGSEGILGVITKATLRLYPKPKKSVTLIVPYDDRHTAINTVPKILHEGTIPVAAEYMEGDLVERSVEHIGKEWPAKEGEAYLYLIVTGDNEEEVFSRCEKISEICQESGAIDILIADRREEQQNILDIRSNIYTALEPDSADILDVTVPPAKLGDLMDEVDKIAHKYDAYIPAYGHVADGNLHPHVMKVDGEGPSYLDDAKEDIYEKAIELGGVITGEHGVGKTRLRNLSQALTEKEIELIRGIKKLFDPNSILNPGTVVDTDEY